MGYQPLENLLPKSNYSVYKLCRLAAVRALELADGAPKLIEISSSAKTATIALEEISAGKVMLKEAAHHFHPVQSKKSKIDKEDKVEQEQVA